MKIVVTHTSPDWDAIGGIWVIKKYLPGWQDATVEFVPAGTKSPRRQMLGDTIEDAIEIVDDDEILHVDTGLGPLDHHQTSDASVSGTSRAWDYVRSIVENDKTKMTDEHIEAVSRIVKVIVDLDHFKEVFWAEPVADYHDFSLFGVLEGLKLANPGNDIAYADFGIRSLDALLHYMESKIWAEREIANNGVMFQTKFGKAIGFETLNDDVIKLSQKMGYMLVIRKDPRKGYVRIKARPTAPGAENIDLTELYEQLKAADPEATWFLHISKKMLLNGTVKNPTMRATKLSLNDIIAIAKDL